MKIQLKKNVFKCIGEQKVNQFEPFFATIIEDSSDHLFPVGTKVLCCGLLREDGVYFRSQDDHMIIGTARTLENTWIINEIQIEWLRNYLEITPFDFYCRWANTSDLERTTEIVTDLNVKLFLMEML